MAAPTVTYPSFLNDTVADGPQVSQNFTDVINAMTDGLKTFTISALTCNGQLVGKTDITAGVNASSDGRFIGTNATNDSYFILKSTGSVTSLWSTYSSASSAKDITFAVGATETVRLRISSAGVVTISNLSTGLVHADSSGVLTSSTLVNADVSASAAIDFSKLATLTAGNVLLGNGSNVATSTALSGDITVNSSGVTAIGSSKVTNTMLAGSIAASKLVGSDIATVGTITSGVWNAGAVTSSGTVTGVAGTFSGVLSTSDTTDATTSTTGSLKAAGGLGVAKSVFLGNRLVKGTDTGFGVFEQSNAAQTVLSGTTQVGVAAAIRGNSSATARTIAISAEPRTEATAFTTGALIGVRVLTPTIGAGSTATRNIGLVFQGIGTGGGTGNAYIADNESFSGNYFINQSGTDASSLGGAVTFAGTTDTSSGTTGTVIVSGGVGVAKSLTVTNSLRLVEATNSTTTTPQTALTSTAGFYVMTGSATISIQGITPGSSGQRLVLYNRTGNTLTLNHNNAGATSNGKVLCPGAVDFTVPNFGCVELIYDSVQSGAWCILSNKTG